MTFLPDHLDTWVPDLTPPDSPGEWTTRVPGAPASLPPDAPLVGRINWATGWTDWPESYWISDSGTGRWILWRLSDSEISGTDLPHPVASCERQTSMQIAAAQLLTAYWSACRDCEGDVREPGDDRIQDILEGGVIDRRQLRAISRSVWPVEAEPEE